MNICSFVLIRGVHFVDHMIDHFSEHTHEHTNTISYYFDHQHGDSEGHSHGNIIDMSLVKTASGEDEDNDSKLIPLNQLNEHLTNTKISYSILFTQFGTSHIAVIKFFKNLNDKPLTPPPKVS